MRIISGFTASSSDEILALREASGLSMRTSRPFRYLSLNAILPDLSLALSSPCLVMLSLREVLSAI